MPNPVSSAEIVLGACARARRLHGRVLVIKLGGSAMEDPVATAGTIASVTALQTLGLRMVLVHGGGKPIDRAMAEAGVIPRKVAGRRYTDDQTLEIVVRVLTELNHTLVEQLNASGAQAVTASDLLIGIRLLLPGLDLQPVDLGRVGTVTGVDTRLSEFLDQGLIPVIPCLACSSEDGGWLNVNADTAAAAVAGFVRAEACYFLTDTPGVLRDVHDSGSLIPCLTEAACRQLILDGVIAGGMIPKVEACFEALAAGASRAVILDGRDPHALLGEFVSEQARGTEIRT